MSIIQKSKTGQLKIYENKEKGMLTFQINNSKSSFHHRDLVNIYYYIIKNIKFYLTKDIKTPAKTIKIKNAVFFSTVINNITKKRVKEEEVDLNEKENFYRVAAIVINKKEVINLNLASLFEIKRIIEEFFKKSNFEIRFKEKDFNLKIQKVENTVELYFDFENKANNEVIKVSSDHIKTLIRNLKEKMIYDWKLYNLRISNKFAIFQTKYPNTFLIKINEKQIEVGRDIIIAISLSV